MLHRFTLLYDGIHESVPDLPKEKRFDVPPRKPSRCRATKDPCWSKRKGRENGEEGGRCIEGTFPSEGAPDKIIARVALHSLVYGLGHLGHPANQRRGSR